MTTVDWNSIKRMYSRETDPLNKLLLGLYTKFPPRKVTDYAKMVVAVTKMEANDASNNYYIIADRAFIFNVYKGSKTYGSQYWIINGHLANLIDKYIQTEGMKTGDKLIGLDQRALAWKVRRLTGKSIMCMRRLFLDTVKGVGHRDKSKILALMGANRL